VRQQILRAGEKLRIGSLRVRLKSDHRNLAIAEKRLKGAIQMRLRQFQQGIQSVEGKLRVLGPQQTLDRGFSITADAETGRVLRSAEEAKNGQQIQTRLARGKIISTVAGKS
jgi:exodeoxyribonuclease VII large subunit